MAKKKKNIPDFEDLMEKMFSNFSEEELMKIAEGMKEMDEKGMNAVMDESYYSYQQPDYRKMCSPVELYLNAVYRAEKTEDVIPSAKKAAEVMEQQQQADREQSVSNLLLNILADHQKDGTVHELGMLGALYLAERFEMTSVSETLLEYLRQNSEFFDQFVDVNATLFSLVISKLCSNQMQKLWDMMFEEGLLPQSHSIVADAVIQMAIDHPERRQEVVDWICQVLTIHAQPNYDHEPGFYDHLGYSLLQIKAVETLKLFKKIYQSRWVPEIEMEGGFKTLRKKMEKGCDERVIECCNVEEFVNIYIENQKAYDAERDFWDEEDEDWDDEDEDWDDENFDDEEFDEYEEVTEEKSLFVPTDIPVNMLTIEVSLNNSPIEVKRTLKVISNLRLSHFGQVLMRAMGWDGYHLHQFIKDKQFYTDKTSVEDSYGDDRVYCFDDYCVGDFLLRKGSKMIWEYDFGDCWRHTIEVTAAEKYIHKSGSRKVVLIEAQNACPPEDCGGVWGYQHLLDVISNPKDPEYKEMREWVGRRFNPKKFDIPKAQKAINNYLDIDLPF